jgi:hypothetical protein
MTHDGLVEREKQHCCSSDLGNQRGVNVRVADCAFLCCFVANEKGFKGCALTWRMPAHLLLKGSCSLL